MPIRSGEWAPDVPYLDRGRIKLRFHPSLASRLELPERIEIRFDVDDATYSMIQQTVAHWNVE
jgi:hypothetical protein